jgi:predicted cobalt transporter CbtA
MADNAVTQSPAPDVPAVPADDENEALLDAHKTFVITVIGSVLFCAAALAIIFGLGM